MRKLKRLHVAAALLMIVSVVSLLGISLAAGTTGSAATKVTIVNTHPVEKNVCWRLTTNPWDGHWSPIYNSWGRTYLHVLIMAWLAEGEFVDVYLWGWLPNATKTESQRITCYHWRINVSDWIRYTTVYVPSKQFSFRITGPTTAKISLSFYLSGS